MAGLRITDIKSNWDWYQSTGFLQDWRYYNYRKVPGPRWSGVIPPRQPDEPKEKLENLMGLDIQIKHRSRSSTTDHGIRSTIYYEI